MIERVRRHQRHLVAAAAMLLHCPPERRSRVARRDHERHEGGYSTESVIITALLVAGAITVAAIIVAKVTAKANSITM